MKYYYPGNILLCTMLALFLTAISSCSKSDQANKRNELVATWESQSLTISVYDARNTLLQKDTETMDDGASRITFNADGTMKSDDDSGNWKLEGNTIVATHTEGSSTVTQRFNIETLTSSKLVLSQRIDDIEEIKSMLHKDAKYIVVVIDFKKV